MDLIDRIAARRGERSIREYARLLGVDHSWLSKLLRRQAEPGTKVLRGFARAFPEDARELGIAGLAGA